MELDLEPLWLTLRLASLTTFILFILGIPLSSLLVYVRFRFKSILETLISMPLVLPPSVLGFYLLVAMSPAFAPGRFFENLFETRLVFSFPGLVIGSVFFSLPFMIHPLKSGMESVPVSLMEASYTMGKSFTVTLMRVVLPNMKSSILSGIVMTFAHTVGEFGVVLMIGGNIPGQTRVASIAIYDEVEALNYAAANMYASILFAITFTILLIVYVVNRRILRGFGA